jgi:hypothetical protein
LPLQSPGEAVAIVVIVMDTDILTTILVAPTVIPAVPIVPLHTDITVPLVMYVLPPTH